jgi:hypothetical protein
VASNSFGAALNVLVLCALINFSFGATPQIGPRLLDEVSRSHTHTHTHIHGRTNGTNDQLVAEAASYTINTKDEHPCPQRDSNSRSQDSSALRPHGPWD